MFKKVLFVAVLASLIASAFSMPVPKLQDGNCPSSPARLKQADIAVVTVGDGETLNLRVQPNLNAERIVKIPAYTYVTIIAGPICDGGYRWFEVGWEGKDGWSAEVGPDGEYNMIPNGDPIPEVDSQENTGENNSNPFGDTPAPIFKVAAGNSYFFRDWDNFQFRTIPNDDTLEALGFPKNQIDIIPGDNLTFDSDFTFGPDVPDVHNDPDGFCTFKYKYFPSYPNPSWSPCQGIVIEPPSNTTVQPTDTPQPLIEAPIEPTETEQEEPSWWCANVGWFCDVVPEAVASEDTNTECNPQCVKEARTIRPDLVKKEGLWSYNTSTAKQIYDAASGSPIFVLDGQVMQVRVRNAGEAPEVNDIVIWPKGCGDNSFGIVTFEGGHIGTVQSYNNGNLIIHDANWNNNCGIRNEQVTLLSCMQFITSPYPSTQPQSFPPGQTQSVNTCIQYDWPQSLFCEWGWIK